MLEYMIGTMRDRGKPRRYLRIKSDAEIAATDGLVTFTRAQEDKVSVYECIVGDLIREETAGGFFYKWYTLESVLVETDHTIRVAAEVENMAPTVSAASVAFVILAEAGQIDDATAAEHAAQFGAWAQPVAYKAGAIRLYEGRLYRCIQAHTSQEGWEPPEAASLWVEIADPAESGPHGLSRSAHMTHTGPGTRSPTPKRNGRPTLTATCGSPAYTDGRNMSTLTI